jgi:hypothetical protein
LICIIAARSEKAYRALMRRIAIVIAAILASISLQSQAQNLDRRSQLVSPPSGQADPGDTVMDLRVTSALPNAFGSADIFGRRVDAGQVVVQYLGMRDGAVVFVRQGAVVSSNENTMNRTPMILNNS